MKSIKVAAVFLAVVFFIFSAFAISFATDQTGYLPKDKVINGDFSSAYQSIDVEGIVNGDVMVAGGMVTFTGKSTGDVLAAGGNIQISGETDGNIRTAGGNIIIDGKVGKNVTAAGGNLVIGENSVVSGNVYVAGGMTEIRGTIDKNLKAAGGSVILSGVVKGNAEIMSDEIVARQGAKIEGNLTYYSNSDLNIDKSVVGGEIVRKNIPVKYSQENSWGAFLFAKFFGFLGFLILGYVFFAIFPKGAKGMLVSLLEKSYWKIAAIGLLAIILIPIAVIFLMITVIGIPLAMVMIFIFIIAMLLSRVMASVALGHVINSRMKPKEITEHFSWGDFILGYLILEVLMLIPFLGPLVAFFIFLWAFGGVVKYIYAGMQKRESGL